MVDEAALDQFVKQSLGAGQNPTAIKAGLLIMGWPIDAVNGSMAKLSPASSLAASTESREPFMAAYPQEHPVSVPVMPPPAITPAIYEPSKPSSQPLADPSRTYSRIRFAFQQHLWLLLAIAAGVLVLGGVIGGIVLVASHSKGQTATQSSTQSGNSPAATTAMPPTPGSGVVAAGECFKVNIASVYQVTSNTPCSVKATKGDDQLIISFDPGNYTSLEDFKKTTLSQLDASQVKAESVTSVTINGQKAYRLTTKSPVVSIIYMFYSSKGYVVDGVKRHAFVVGESGSGTGSTTDT
ncbi:MAG TPA: hypothetical protein VLF41_01860, partial [Candidatus Nanoarchaeia archaeon]|nr:hypothetical protein [Candidatus Nanoarchaeia archaeon]